MGRFGVSDDVVIEVWTKGLVNTLLDPGSDGESNSIADDLLTMANVGFPVWSDEYFSDSKGASIASSSTGGPQSSNKAIMSNMFCGEVVPTGLAMADPATSSIQGSRILRLQAGLSPSGASYILGK